jgi:multicomponent Na+:H+ antiporter subunit G
LFEALKLVGVWLLTLLAGATVTQLIARTARPGGPPV